MVEVGKKRGKSATKTQKLKISPLFSLLSHSTSNSIPRPRSLSKTKNSDGYKVCDPPATYVPIMTPARKLSSSAPPLAGAQTGFFMSDQQAIGGAGSASAAAAAVGIDLLPSIEGLPELRPEDAQYFGKLLAEVDEDELTLEEAKERRIMKLLLKVKNGTPQQRKSALRTLGDKAREFGAGPLFNQILPLLMSPALDDQERHVLVKVVDRVLRKLDELVRPYVHKVLVVVEPLLIDEDYYARIEGREIIANLAKAAGLATMIAAMRPVRNFVDNVTQIFFFSTRKKKLTPFSLLNLEPKQQQNIRTSTPSTSTSAIPPRAPSPSSPRRWASRPSCPSSRRYAAQRSRGRRGTRASRSCSRPPFCSGAGSSRTWARWCPWSRAGSPTRARPRSGRWPAWPWPLWRKRRRLTASTPLTTCWSLCGKGSGCFAGRPWLRISRPSATLFR